MRLTNHLPAAAVVAVLAAAGPAAAQPHHNAALHFTVDVPAGWKRLSTKELAESQKFVESRAGRAGQGKMYDDGFRREVAPLWFSPPFVLVHFEPVKTAGMTAAEVEKAAAQDFGAAAKEVQGSMSDVLADLSLGSAGYDRAKHRLFLRMKGKYTDGQTFEGLMVGHVGAEGIVAIYYITSGTLLPNEVKMFERLNDSFRFDDGFAFTPAEPGGDVFQKLTQLAGGRSFTSPVVIGGAAVLGVGVVGGLLLRRPKPARTTPW